MNKKKGRGWLWNDLTRYAELYLLVLPVILFYLLFCYKPMYGIIIAFKNYKPMLGILDSPWVGFKQFEMFFESYYFGRILKNTMIISFSSILFTFPVPIIFALLLNEIKNDRFKRITQTITYMPHFISMVVVCSMIKMFTSRDGFITEIAELFGGADVSLLTIPSYFVPIYVGSAIWQQVGWNAIIYLAALSGIDQELYDAAYM